MAQSPGASPGRLTAPVVIGLPAGAGALLAVAGFAGVTAGLTVLILGLLALTVVPLTRQLTAFFADAPDLAADIAAQPAIREVAGATGLEADLAASVTPTNAAALLTGVLGALGGVLGALGAAVTHGGAGGVRENWVIYPRVMSRAVEISALAALVSAMVGFAMFGVLGVLLAVPVFGSIQLLVRELVLGRQASR